MLPIGTVFGGRFRIDRVAPGGAGGGMGVVYEVFDQRADRVRALKVMQAHPVGDAKKRADFEREAREGVRIGSEHVVEVLDQGIDPATGVPWILMEMLRGETLATASALLSASPAPRLPIAAVPTLPTPTGGALVRTLGLGVGALVLVALGAGLMHELGGHCGSASVHHEPASVVIARHITCAPGMVAIRGGEFTMGDGLDPPHDLRHRARVSPFCLDATEVTVAQFRGYWSGAGHPPPAGSVQYPGGNVPWTGRVTEPVARDQNNARCTWTGTPAGHENLPINCVDWYTMQAYCVSRGGRLPTEAEWEFAARGIYIQTYPWGNEPPTGARLNACGEECPYSRMTDFGRDAFPEIAPVGSFQKTRPPGVFFDDDPNGGLYDMAGNVWEWVADGYVDYPADSSNVPVDPVTVDGSSRVLRGGGWDFNDPSWVRAARRDFGTPDFRNLIRGGRCARGGR